MTFLLGNSKTLPGPKNCMDKGSNSGHSSITHATLLFETFLPLLEMIRVEQGGGGRERGGGQEVGNK